MKRGYYLGKYGRIIIFSNVCISNCVFTLEPPIPFENIRVMIEDRSEFNNPVATMLNSSNGLVNLKDFITSEEFEEKWRWRIDEITVC